MTTIDVVFDDVWLLDPTNPTVTVHASSPERAHTVAGDGEVRTYASGRRRVISNARHSATYPITLQWLTVADVRLLEGWRNRNVLLRDGLGLRVYGTYTGIDTSDRYVVGGWRSISTFTLTAVDVDEAV